MPTGIEETLGAIAAFIIQNLATSPFAGTPDPNGAIEAGDSAHFAPSPILDVAVLEGTSGTVAVAEAPSDGAAHGEFASTVPVDGDHPPVGTVYERPAIHDEQPAIEYIYTDPEVIVVGPEPPGPKDQVDDPAPIAPDGITQSSMPDGAQPPLQPPMWVPPPPTGIVALTPPALPNDGSNSRAIGVPADWADRWEANHEYSWSKLLFNRSGEQATRDAKHAVEEALGDFIDWSPNGSDVPEQERADRAVVAGVAQTLFDVGFGLVVVPVLDPSSVVRGILRTGVTSATGIEDIKQGRTLEGSLKITGEVSAIVLTAAAPIRAVVAKGPPPAAAEASVTVFLETGGKGIEAVTGAHNAVRITIPKTGSKPARDVFTEVSADTAQNLDVIASAKVKTFDAAKAAERLDLRGGQVASYTRPLSPEAARRAAAFADRAADMTFKDTPGAIADFAGRPADMAARMLDTGVGRAGPFSAMGEHCSTYAAALARAGGIPAAGRFGPHLMYLMFKYGGPPGQGLAATGAAIGMMGNASPGPVAPPGG
jgi:hypothetical protein